MTSSPAPDLEPRTEAERVTPEAQPETVAHVHSLHIGGYGIWCGTRQGPGYGADGLYFKFDQTAELQAHLSAEATDESGRLREALRETLDFIDAADGHSYCDTQRDPAWDCSCGFDAKRERWADALLATPPAPSDHGAGEPK